MAVNTSKPSIVIIHYQPIEYYPPAQNIINFFPDDFKKIKIFVVTTLPRATQVQRFTANAENILILRKGGAGGKSRIQRFFHYLYFNTTAFLVLCRQCPESVLYFETLSSFPVYLYKKFINRQAKILIHYHEYTAPVEYRKGMALERIFHSFEKYLYPRASWLSHTNEDRMGRFIKDISPVSVRAPEILPNYPPASWQQKTDRANIANPLRIVYAGALGMDTMYIKKFATWVEAQQGLVQWHIYSQQDGKELIQYLLSENFTHIFFKGNVKYDELPATLYKYDVGVILYKGHLANYIYNAPNKLFEYTVCGLDVWFPVQMTSSLPYQTKGTYPKIVAVDFGALHDLKFKNLVEHDGLKYRPNRFDCETVLAPLFLKLKSIN